MYQLTGHLNGSGGGHYKGLSETERNQTGRYKKLRKFSEEIADNINKDFPGSATVENNCCYIKDEYWESCKNYVQANYKLNGH